jgi:hypothetical protein
MILIFHLASALLSIIVSSTALFRPSQRKLRTSYVLIGTTFASGTYLVIATSSPLLQACLSGITYLAVVAVLTAVARWRLARQTAD